MTKLIGQQITTGSPVGAARCRSEMSPYGAGGLEGPGGGPSDPGWVTEAEGAAGPRPAGGVRLGPTWRGP